MTLFISVENFHTLSLISRRLAALPPLLYSLGSVRREIKQQLRMRTHKHTPGICFLCNVAPTLAGLELLGG